MHQIKNKTAMANAEVNLDNIRDWYVHNFPTDKYGYEINPTLTFGGLDSCINFAYRYLDIMQACVVERIFKELSERLGMGGHTEALHSFAARATASGRLEKVKADLEENIKKLESSHVLGEYAKGRLAGYKTTLARLKAPMV